MTKHAQHVTHLQSRTRIPTERMSVRFDYYQRGDGRSLGVVYPLVNEQLPSSPINTLDFALLRIVGKPADDPAV